MRAWQPCMRVALHTICHLLCLVIVNALQTSVCHLLCLVIVSALQTSALTNTMHTSWQVLCTASLRRRLCTKLANLCLPR